MSKQASLHTHVIKANDVHVEHLPNTMFVTVGGSGILVVAGGWLARLKLALNIVIQTLTYVPQVVHLNLTREQAIKLNDDLIAKLYYTDDGEYMGEMHSDAWHDPDLEEPDLNVIPH